MCLTMINTATSRGSRSIFSPDSKISGRIIGHVRPKKGVPNPNFTPTQESPTITPAPPLTKIGHQLYHGGGSISSNMALTKKRPRQRITYPLGSTLMRAFLFMCCFRCKTAFCTLNNRIDNDDNYIISAGNVFIRIVGNPPLPPKDARPPPKTPHVMRLPSIVGGRWLCWFKQWRVARSPIVGAASKQH